MNESYHNGERIDLKLRTTTYIIVEFMIAPMASVGMKLRKYFNAIRCRQNTLPFVAEETIFKGVAFTLFLEFCATSVFAGMLCEVTSLFVFHKHCMPPINSAIVFNKVLYCIIFFVIHCS